jgi:hypothetical protein
MPNSDLRLMLRASATVETDVSGPKNRSRRSMQMPIAMQKFASDGHLVQFDRYAGQRSTRAADLVLQCRVCNFEPDLNRPMIRVCPKCHASTWEWIVRRHHVEPSERPGHRRGFRIAEWLRVN